ncbi:hypothetical protein [Xylophilus rhododendri]|uniref:hypothetical protein n=1 Tax=Xylophilus rhododendri TaxID=2697032 RepID=UPI001E39B04F|nr:hypothetical protein [Xylophilus rhododendri]
MSPLRLKRLRRAASAAVLVGLALADIGGAFGQQQSLEERLRTQLRATTLQLQQAQNELAVLKAAPARAPAPAAAAANAPATEELKKELAQARAQLAAERQARERAGDDNQKLAQQARAVTDKAATQVAQYRGAYDELLKMAKASEAERQRLATAYGAGQGAVERCEAQNKALYATGQEILHAYETMDVSTVLAARQPFAAQSRVKLEQVAQQYGDKLYEGRFDARATPAPAAATTAH